jgi:hypothetical protein
MGWNSCVPGAFGKCLVECLEQVVDDPGVLLQERFRKILAAAGEDWMHIVVSLNGGKNQTYNLHGFKGRAEEIGKHCRKAVRPLSESIDGDIDWEDILEDVKRVSEIALYEMQNNIVTVAPCGSQCEITNAFGIKRQYYHMPTPR